MVVFRRIYPPATIMLHDCNLTLVNKMYNTYYALGAITLYFVLLFYSILSFLKVDEEFWRYLEIDAST